MKRLAWGLAVALLGAACDRSPEPPRPLPEIAVDPCPGAEELLARPATGAEVLPDLTLDCVGDGPAVALRRLGRRPTLVNLWASWCGPCQREMPALQRIAAAAGDRLRVLGIDIRDHPRPARGAIQKTGVRYPSVADPDDLVRARMSLPGVPVTLLVDGAGRVVHRHVGELDEGELREIVRRHLGVSL